MSTLRQKIIKLIRTSGPVPFEQFMSMALYDPDFGYYNSESLRIGREGDFYTSSHLHPVFGAIIGRQIREMWEVMGRPDDFMIVEMGAGAGYVCKDVLDSLQHTDFLSALRYTIIERSPSMRGYQQRLLKEFSAKVDWIADLSEISSFEGCIFSNELLDAFPVHLVRMEDDLKEVYLDFDEGKGFIEQAGDLSREEISHYFRDFSIEIEKGYTTEVNLRIKDWLNEINNVLARGFILTVDYGYPAWDYYSEDRNRGTILCYHEHQLSENPYLNIGEQDITAHVNFSAVKKWGEEIGIETAGYCGQGVFMVSLGIDDDMKKIAETSNDFVFEIARIKKLILPQGMGESHKVMIQYKGIEAPKLKGFSIRNQIKTL
ncbi:MAG: SAM-dependent methyltransferase [Nitrospiraceae bacterium]|nr:MAG: SAM-dependent methyltransferase [Nitrospiraceae bacterium]